MRPLTIQEIHKRNNEHIVLKMFTVHTVKPFTIQEKFINSKNSVSCSRHGYSLHSETNRIQDIYNSINEHVIIEIQIHLRDKIFVKALTVSCLRNTVYTIQEIHKNFNEHTVSDPWIQFTRRTIQEILKSTVELIMSRTQV